MKEVIRDFLNELKYKGYEYKDGIYYIHCETKSKSYKHPTKEVTTKSVKGTFYKTVNDLPFNDKPVKLVIKMKTYAFYNLENERKYFEEELSFLPENQRIKRTNRLEKYILDHASTTSSNATEKEMKKHGVIVSDTTINRMIIKNNKKK